MNIGHLYFDNSKTKTIVEKINFFINMYKNKYGVTPNKCHVNKEEYEKNKEVLSEMTIEVSPDLFILKEYFWLGVDKADFKFYSDIKANIKESEEEERKLYV